jgi:hypothetical protein
VGLQPAPDGHAHSHTISIGRSRARIADPFSAFHGSQAAMNGPTGAVCKPTQIPFREPTRGDLGVPKYIENAALLSAAPTIR